MNRFFQLNLLLVLCLLPWLTWAQNKRTLRGSVRDGVSEAALPGVSISCRETASGTVTEADGLYSLTLPSGTYTILITSVGYQRQVRTITLDGDDTRLDVRLTPANVPGNVRNTTASGAGAVGFFLVSPVRSRTAVVSAGAIRADT